MCKHTFQLGNFSNTPPMIMEQMATVDAQLAFLEEEAVYDV